MTRSPVAPFFSPLQSCIRGPRRAGIDMDEVGGFEHDSRAIAVHHADMRRGFVTSTRAGTH